MKNLVIQVKNSLGCKSGINEAWSGKMGNRSIYTNVVVADNSIYKTIKITITEATQLRRLMLIQGSSLYNCTKPTSNC